MDKNRAHAAKDYVNLQEEYMDGIHIPDYKAADKLWKTTLYQPLQEYLNVLLSKTEPKKPISFVYIGAGPEAPVFFESDPHLKIASRINSLLLVDVSARYLIEAKEKIKRAYPALKVETACIDITAGFGQIFSTDLTVLVERSDSLLDLHRNITELTTYALPTEGNNVMVTDSNDIPKVLIKDGDIVYSELLATFTGTAAMFKMEKLIVEKFGNQRCFHKDWIITKAGLQSLWQRYNEVAYLYQLDTMSRLVRRNGLIAIATDTEKRFEDSSHKSIFSFSSATFPPHNMRWLNKLEEFSKNVIWWEDSLRSHSSGLNAQSTIEALLPHKHKIEFATYRCLA